MLKEKGFRSLSSVRERLLQELNACLGRGKKRGQSGGYPWAYNEIGQLETWGNHDKPSGFRGTPLVLDKPIRWHILIWCRIHKFIPRELTMCVAADPNDGSLLIGGGFTTILGIHRNP